LRGEKAKGKLGEEVFVGAFVPDSPEIFEPCNYLGFEVFVVLLDIEEIAGSHSHQEDTFGAGKIRRWREA